MQSVGWSSSPFFLISIDMADPSKSAAVSKAIPQQIELAW